MPNFFSRLFNLPIPVRLQDGSRCDFSGECDTLFEICIGEKCRIRYPTQVIPNRNDVDGSQLNPNPMEFTISAWPIDGPLSVHVTARDDDGGKSSVIASFPLELSIQPVAFSKSITYEAGIAQDSEKTLRYEVAARCKENYYGPQCTVYCIGPDCLTTTTTTTTATEPTTTVLVTEPATSTSIDSEAMSDTTQSQPVPQILSQDPPKESTSLSNSQPSEIASAGIVVAVVVVTSVILCVVMVPFAVAMRRRNMTSRGSRIPVLFEADDLEGGSVRTTVVSYSDTCESGGQRRPKSNNYVSRLSASENAEAVNNPTYFMPHSISDARVSVREDASGVYNRPPPPRPVHSASAGDWLGGRKSTAQQNIYCTPTDVRSYDEYYNHST